MPQTDRQTDKASNWKTAVFDIDDNWSKLEQLPDFVKTIHKQKEICPTTQRPHFQIHVITHRQVRLTQMCSWIKATKWIPVTGKEHIRNSINYCSKNDTAVPGTQEVVQGQRYYQIHELLYEVALQHTQEDEDETNPQDWLSRRTWGRLTSRLVAKDLSWATRLSNPALEKCWRLWGETFLAKAKESGSSIIEGPAPQPGRAEGGASNARASLDISSQE